MSGDARILLKDKWIWWFAVPILILFTLLLGPGIPDAYAQAVGDFLVDPIVLGIIALSYWRARQNTGHPEERRFWTALSAAFALAVLIPLMDLSWSSPGHSSSTYFLADVLYLVFYLGLFIALEASPHRHAGWSQRDRTARLDTIGAVVFVFVLLVYAVLIPSRFRPDEYESFVPSLATYFSLDILLIGRLLNYRRTSKSPEWSSLYGWLAVGITWVALNDFRELVYYSFGMPMPRGGCWDVMWYPPLLAFVCAGRLAVLRPALASRASESRTSVLAPDLEAASVPRCTLAVYSCLLPALHLIWYSAGFLDHSLRNLRDFVILVGLLTLATMTIFQFFLLNRYNRDLRQKLAQAEENLHQSRRMEAVGRLAGGVAHDFNNLLMVIRGFAEILEDDARSDAARRSASSILSATDRAVALTRQLLAFSRKQVVAPRALELNEVVTSIDSFLRRLVGNHIDLQVQSVTGLWAVYADRGQMEQVLMNLAANARDAMPQGGQLRIRTRNVTLDAAGAEHLDLSAPGDYVALDVYDTGAGMCAETRSRIFEPFFTTKATGKGTGLGLATVYAIIRQNQGAIEVHSTPGSGTQFTVYLPRTMQSVETLKSPSAEDPACGSETILLVEDESEVRWLTGKFLSESGYAVLEAGSPEEALRIASAERSIHLLVTDVIMPGMSGREMAEKLTASQPHMRVLFMSGHTDDAVMVHGVAEHSVEFLQKPFTRDALLGRVREVLASA